jgi:chorismate dehydratase
MKHKKNLVLVNYLNAKPFAAGLLTPESQYHFHISLQNPAQCARDYTDGKADIALLPVGALLQIPDYQIITDYCIGCDGAVRTVAILSHVPLSQCKRLLLDNHSRTSFLLSQLILEEYLHISLPCRKIEVQSFQADPDDAILMIGDKVFEQESNFAFRLDLGMAWKEWTGLPFVFAVWVASKEIDSFYIRELETAIAQGMTQLNKIIGEESHDNLDLLYYYTHNISYELNQSKKDALSLFLSKITSPHFTV